MHVHVWMHVRVHHKWARTIRSTRSDVCAYTYLLAVDVFLSADLSTVTRYCPIHVELIIVGQKLLHVRAVDGVERVSVSGECLTDRQRCAPSRLSQIRDDVNETVLLISTSSTMYATRPVFVESLHGLIAQKTTVNCSVHSFCAFSRQKS